MADDKRACNFATILYQESVVDNYISIIDSWHVKGHLSPLHDKDTLDDGTPKKPHWHLLLHFDSARWPDAVREKFISIGGVGCEVVDSYGGYARYLCHLDNPKKAQYKVEDVRSFGGACYEDDIVKGQNKFMVYAEIMDYIDTCHIRSYAQLLRYARHFKKEWFQALCKNGMVIKDYLRSNNFDNDQNMKGQV